MVDQYTASRWLPYFEADYLDTYVPAGGSVLKLLVAEDERTRAGLEESLRNSIVERGILPVFIDSSAIRVDRMEDIFFEVARSIDWRLIAEDLAISCLRETLGLDLIGRPQPGESVSRWASAQSDLTVPALSQQINQWALRDLLNYVHWRRDFASGMVALVMMAGSGMNDEHTQPIIDWLRGDLRSLASLKPFSIGTKVNRSNARSFFESTAALMMRGSKKGLAVVVDYETLVSGTMRTLDQRRYSNKQLLDAWEVLRQFVDSISDVRGCAFVAISGAGVLDENQKSRGLVKYPALRARLVGDVADVRFVNPLAATIRIGGC
jgi:hypothetical protein